MLSYKILTGEDIECAAHYYEGTVDDYYETDSKQTQWQGEGAKKLGLEGVVDKVEFRKLLAGGNLNNSRAATRLDNEQRIGIDLTFSAPKSVSLQGLVGRDIKVIEAHKRAVSKALKIVEQKAQARKKVKGKTFVEYTGNLIIAQFMHEQSREQDPQLHTHAVLMNITQRADKQWRALKNDEIIKSIKYIGAVYRSELAHELQSIGYQIRQEQGGVFELEHISRQQLLAFSKRSMQVEQLLTERGLTRETASTEEKQLATLKSRKSKAKVLQEQNTIQQWQKLAMEVGIEFVAADKQRAKNLEQEKQRATDVGQTKQQLNHESLFKQDKIAAVEISSDKEEIEKLTKPSSKQLTQIDLNIQVRAEAARRAVRFAIRHLTERQAVIKERDLLEIAIDQAVGTTAGIKEIENEISWQVKSGYLIKKQPIYVSATREVEMWNQQQSKRSKLANVEVGKKQLNKQHDNNNTIKDGNVGRSRAEWVREVRLGVNAKQMSKTAAIRYVKKAIQSGRLVQQEMRYTTKTALRREQNILRSELQGRGRCQPILAMTEASLELEKTNLNIGQKAAAKCIVTNSNNIIGVQGYAGTGKSQMLKATKQLLEARGYNMCALAPYGGQVKGLNKLGISSKTIAGFLSSIKKDIDERTVIVVDEAGVMPSRLMERVIEVSQQAGSRLVLIGDTGQMQAIEAGRPFAQLQKAGMTTVYMQEIKRQSNKNLKEAVELAARGESQKSLQRVSGDIVEIGNSDKRQKAIARYYISLSKQERQQTVIVSGTNAAKNNINESIRKGLLLTGCGKQIWNLKKRDLTRAEASQAQNYYNGDLIKVECNYPKIGLKQGTDYIIINANGNRANQITVIDEQGQRLNFNPANKKLSSYSPELIEVSIGDAVRITRNDTKTGVVNGDRFIVQAIEANNIVLSEVGAFPCNNKFKPEHQASKVVIIATDKPVHIDYAYATTIHSSQGLENERALIDADSRSITTAKEAYYVAISRAKKAVKIYTDSRQKLSSAIGRSREKTVALEIDRAVGR